MAFMSVYVHSPPENVSMLLSNTKTPPSLSFFALLVRASAR
jgi:hypothetical protein